MQMPPPDPDTLFADLLQDLPSETVAMAREFKAFVRAKKVKTPQQLLRVVLLYCGVDKSLRETAADFTLLYESITDSSIAERLAACRPWVQAVLAKILHTNAVAMLPTPWRFLVLDGSSVQGPGAQGTQYRLHICMDLVQLQFVSITVTDQHTGESLVHFSLGPGDIPRQELVRVNGSLNYISRPHLLYRKNKPLGGKKRKYQMKGSRLFQGKVHSFIFPFRRKTAQKR